MTRKTWKTGTENYSTGVQSMLLLRYEQKDKKNTHSKNTCKNTHTQTQKFLGRHMVRRQVRNIRCLTCCLGWKRKSKWVWGYNLEVTTFNIMQFTLTLTPTLIYLKTHIKAPDTVFGDVGISLLPYPNYCSSSTLIMSASTCRASRHAHNGSMGTWKASGWVQKTHRWLNLTYMLVLALEYVP